MFVELAVNEGSVLINLDDVEKVVLEGDSLKILHKRVPPKTQWTDTYRYDSNEAAIRVYGVVKAQMAEIGLLYMIPDRLPAPGPGRGLRPEISDKQALTFEDGQDKPALTFGGEGGKSPGESTPSSI